MPRKPDPLRQSFREGWQAGWQPMKGVLKHAVAGIASVTLVMLIGATFAFLGQATEVAILSAIGSTLLIAGALMAAGVAVTAWMRFLRRPS